MSLRHLPLHGFVSLLALVGAGLVGPAQAQDLRDPTVPPSVGSAGSGEPSQSPLGMEGGLSVIVRNGQAGLVVGTRVVQPGQKVGAWTLERITETEVWLRDGAKLRKLPRFAGIQRHDPAQAPPCAVPSAAHPHPKARGVKTGKPASASPASPASTKVDPQCDAPLTRSSIP